MALVLRYANLMSSPFGSSVFAPGAKDAAIEFHETSQILSTLSVSCYVLGYAVCFVKNLMKPKLIGVPGRPNVLIAPK